MNAKDSFTPRPPAPPGAGPQSPDPEVTKPPHPPPPPPARDAQLERAIARTEQAEARTKEVRTRIEQAETRAEQAEARTEQAKTRTEQAESRTEAAETRSELVTTRSEEAAREFDKTYRLLAAIVESSDDAIIGKDLNSVITSWNGGAERLFGYTAGEMVGTSILRLIPADLRHEDCEILDKIRRGENVEHFETRRQTRAGLLIDVSISASPIKDAEGRVLGVSKVAHDISRRKKAEEKLAQLNSDLESRVTQRTEQLKIANEELEAFSYSVSHDLRAPLRHIIGFVELLQKNAPSEFSDKSLRHLVTISQSARRMGTLIDDLLAFSKVGRSEMQKTTVNLDELVREAVAEFQAETGERKIAWTVHPLPSMQADRALLRMALVNLISNAVKFTRARAEATIEIGSVSGENGETSIFVRDNGAGFNPKYADKLFGVFQRLHDQNEFEGTGIGLANVKRIISRHAGRVWAEGAVELGATFWFSLPNNPSDLSRTPQIHGP